MLRIHWTSIDIQTNTDAEMMRANYRNTAHHAAAFDTEADGLNYMRATPFLFQFGWYDKETMRGWTYAVDLELHPILARQVIHIWHMLVRDCRRYMGHNVKYDLHMMDNIGEPYDGDNLTDGMIWIRLGTNAVQQKFGGAPLGLKPFATQYIDSNARFMENRVKEERSKISAQFNLQLKQALGWTKKQIDAFFGDKLNSAQDLPSNLYPRYMEWHNSLPLYLQPRVHGAVEADMISYATLNRKNVTEYGHYDIIYELELFDRMEEIVILRENLDAVEIENSNILPLYRMEKVGLDIDVPYLKECEVAVKNYIRIRRNDMKQLAMCEISVGQHALIKEVLLGMGLEVVSTGSEELDVLRAKLMNSGDNQQALDFIEVVQELRTLEKWYSTYILRFLSELYDRDKLYTAINQATPITGRVSSDFQQFPKDVIKTVSGEELFSPRRMVKVRDGFLGTIYLDYSQVELRIQAMYTILVGNGEGDLNLCRAYMPYKCHTWGGDEQHQIKKQFDCYDAWCIVHSYDTAWYLDESPGTVWTPTDVHGATTKAAFDMDEQHPNYHKLRYVGKRVNFAKNYGASFPCIRAMFPEYSDEMIHKIDDAYYIAFPGVKKYHQYCTVVANTKPYAQNLFGVKYYGVPGHNLKNTLIQGTGAYILKTVIPIIDKYLIEHNYKSLLQLQIHDELSFLWHPDDPADLFFSIKHKMEDWDDFLVPIIADMEITTTNWADKKGVETIEEIQDTICNRS